jgi:hypothetical protein
MTGESQYLETRPPGAGQVVLPRAAPFLAPADQVRILSGLSDPALSEVGLDELLDEVLGARPASPWRRYGRDPAVRPRR